MGNLDKAADDFQQALNINPEDPLTHWNLAETLDRQGDNVAAIEHYQEALELEPTEHWRVQIRQKLRNLGMDTPQSLSPPPSSEPPPDFGMSRIEKLRRIGPYFDVMLEN